MESIVTRVERLEEEVATIQRKQNNTNKSARKQVTQCIQSLKREGKKKFDVIDLHLKTKLPFPDINEALEHLHKEGKVHEVR
ncbi:hypothetical protein CMO91_01600 [Candidatus Woesearchaeota archaeon]|nr:hypothetical protein [Candidatus Woesearchaeota archaeon]|tara:strand:- start:653 stop:898 length:246 start_codon:yes stop_codon:yes gene_type:complete